MRPRALVPIDGRARRAQLARWMSGKAQGSRFFAPVARELGLDRYQLDAVVAYLRRSAGPWQGLVRVSRLLPTFWGWLRHEWSPPGIEADEEFTWTPHHDHAV